MKNTWNRYKRCDSAACLMNLMRNCRKMWKAHAPPKIPTATAIECTTRTTATLLRNTSCSAAQDCASRAPNMGEWRVLKPLWSAQSGPSGPSGPSALWHLHALCARPSNAPNDRPLHAPWSACPHDRREHRGIQQPDKETSWDEQKQKNTSMSLQCRSMRIKWTNQWPTYFVTVAICCMFFRISITLSAFLILSSRRRKTLLGNIERQDAPRSKIWQEIQQLRDWTRLDKQMWHCDTTEATQSATLENSQLLARGLALLPVDLHKDPQRWPPNLGFGSKRMRLSNSIWNFIGMHWLHHTVITKRLLQFHHNPLTLRLSKTYET